MAEIKKFLDSGGLTYFCKKFQDYPSNEILGAVINAIDNTKVDKVEGKDLSTNDYTNEDKNKLDSSITFNEQNLSDEQQAQARANIGAADKQNVEQLTRDVHALDRDVNGYIDDIPAKHFRISFNRVWNANTNKLHPSAAVAELRFYDADGAELPIESVTADSEYSAAYSATKVLDGDLATFWSSKDAEGVVHTLECVLTEAGVAARIGIVPRKDVDVGRLDELTVEASADGAVWTQVLHIENEKDGWESMTWRYFNLIPTQVIGLPMQTQIDACRADAVLHTMQSLTEDQQAQARENIAASSKVDIAQIKEEMALRDVFVTPEMFGAVGDGVTDDTAAIQAAINAADKVVFGNKTYLVNKVQFDKSVELVGGTDTVIRTQTRKHAFYCSANPKATLTMTEDYVWTDYTGNCGSTRIAVSDASQVEIGNVLKIVAGNQLYHPNRPYYYKGATVLVTDVDRENNIVSIGFVIPFDILADGTRIEVYKGNTLRMHNINLKSELHDGDTVSSFGVYIHGGANCVIENCTFEGFTHNVHLYYCVNTTVRACRMAKAKWDNALNWDGYGIGVSSCNNTVVELVTCCCGQHALSPGGTIPVFGTQIRNCQLFSECREYAIGCHENTYDIVIENSVIGGAWFVGNVTVRNTRFAYNEALGSKISITGNEGALNDIIEFDHVTFDQNMQIAISASDSDRTQYAFYNNIGRIVFNNCYGGLLYIVNLKDHKMIKGSTIRSITVNNWLECHRFRLEYATIEILKIDGLRFHLEYVGGYITSVTEIEIGSECNVLKMIDGEESSKSYDALALKASAVGSEQVTGRDIVIKASENTRIASLQVFGNPDEVMRSDTIVFEGDNLIAGLADFSIELHDANLNHDNHEKNFPSFKIPDTWKAKRFYLSATIDTTEANINYINSVAAYLYDSAGNLIYKSKKSGKYEHGIYRSTVQFIIPDKAYSMVISGYLSASGGCTIRAYDYKFYQVTELNVVAQNSGYLMIPVSDGGSFTDENGQQYLSNYVDFDWNTIIRQVDYLNNYRVAADWFTDMSDYFSENIVGGFIPREVVEYPSKFGAKLDCYQSSLPVLETDSPPTDAESIWIHDGGIGFAYSVDKVGARTMDALAEYVKTVPDFILTRIYRQISYTINQTVTTLFNSIRLQGGSTRVYSKNGAYFRIGYYRDTKDYIDEQISTATSGKYELIQDVTLTEEQMNVKLENLNLKKLVIFSYVKFVDGSGKYGAMSINGTIKNVAFGGDCNPSDFTRGFMSMDCSEGLLLCQSSDNISNNYSYGTSKQPFKSTYEPVLLDSINSMTIGSWNSYKFAPESRFIIYGVRK